jgi:hypothetical protein
MTSHIIIIFRRCIALRTNIPMNNSSDNKDPNVGSQIEFYQLLNSQHDSCPSKDRLRLSETSCVDTSLWAAAGQYVSCIKKFAIQV